MSKEKNNKLNSIFYTQLYQSKVLKVMKQTLCDGNSPSRKKAKFSRELFHSDYHLHLLISSKERFYFLKAIVRIFIKLRKRYFFGFCDLNVQINYLFDKIDR